MADIKLQIVNQALTACAEDPVSDLSGQNALTRIAIEHYDDLVNEELEKNQPKFAQTTGTPSLLSGTLGEPLQYRWQPPSGVLTIVNVLHFAVPMDGEDYEVEGAIIRCRFNTDVTVRYIRRVAEEFFTYAFRRIIVTRLEAIMLRFLEENDRGDDRDRAAEIKSVIARHRDAKQRGNRPIAPGSLALARFGLVRRR